MFFIKCWFIIVLFNFCNALENFNDTNLSSFMSHRSDDHCEILLESFATATSNFTFCAIRFARPIKLCQLCVGKYQIVEDVYQDILTLKDEEGEQCREKLINLDRLQVVEAGFSYADGLWRRANCNKCFICDDNGHPTKQLNQNTQEVLKLSNETQTCIQNHRHDISAPLRDPKVCTECKSSYQALNSHYDSLKEQGFCMDIVDLMNATRSQWSNELACCLDRKKPEWLFLVSSVVFACLPLAFYLAAYLFVSHKEHTLLKQRRLNQRNMKPSTSSGTMMSPD